MANDFKIGDVVELKSGSAPMTVTYIKSGEIYCKWFNTVKDFPQSISLGASDSKFTNHQIGYEVFPPEALELVKNSK